MSYGDKKEGCVVCGDKIGNLDSYCDICGGWFHWIKCGVKVLSDCGFNDVCDNCKLKEQK